MTSAELGLELTGPLGHAYIVPRYDKRSGGMVATFQVGWKGLIALAFRSGEIASMPIRTVYQNDTFNCIYGTRHSIIHEPANGDPGNPIGYYAIANYKNGGYDFEYWSHEKVMAHRMKFSPPPNGKPDYSAWATAEESMCQKTVARALCRRLSLCPEAQRAASEDEYGEAGVFANSAEHSHSSEQRTTDLLKEMDEMFGEGEGEEGKQPTEEASQ